MDIKDSLSFPSSELLNDEEWQQLKDELMDQSELFAKSIEDLHESKLQEKFFDEKIWIIYPKYRWTDRTRLLSPWTSDPA